MRAKGIFISEHQGTYKWIEGKVDYIFQRASIGLYKDTKYDEFLPEVRKTERRIGVHYFLTEVDPIEQAEFFFRAQAGQGFKALAFDYEERHNKLDEQGEANLWLFYQHLKTLTNKRLLLYCGEYTLRDYLLKYNDRWLEIEQWIARYPGNVDIETFEPFQLGVRDDWTFWQWEADGNEKGEEYGVGSDDICLDVFNGTVADLDDWLDITDTPIDCSKLIEEAVVEVNAEWMETVADMEAKHSVELEEAIIKANNTALENLIKPHKM